MTTHRLQIDRSAFHKALRAGIAVDGYHPVSHHNDAGGVEIEHHIVTVPMAETEATDLAAKINAASWKDAADVVVAPSAERIAAGY